MIVRKLYVLLSMLSLIWGTSFLFIKVLIEVLSPAEVVFWRCFFGALTLLAIIIWKKQSIGWKSLPWFSLLVVAVFNNALPWLLIAMSETKISSGLASVFNATTPLWTAIIGYIGFKKRLRLLQWTGIVLGFVGILFLVDFNPKGLTDSHFIGAGTMLMAAGSYGFASQFSKKHLGHMNVLVLSFVTLTFSALLSFGIAAFTTTITLPAIMEMKIFTAAIGLGVLGSGIAIIVFYTLIRDGGADFAALVTYLIPVTAVLWGKLFLDESLSIPMLMGMLIILSGIYIASGRIKLRRYHLLDRYRRE